MVDSVGIHLCISCTRRRLARHLVCGLFFPSASTASGPGVEAGAGLCRVLRGDSHTWQTMYLDISISIYLPISLLYLRFIFELDPVLLHGSGDCYKALSGCVEKCKCVKMCKSLQSVVLVVCIKSIDPVSCLPWPASALGITASTNNHLAKTTSVDMILQSEKWK